MKIIQVLFILFHNFINLYCWNYKCNEFLIQDGLCPGDPSWYSMCPPTSSNVAVAFNFSFTIVEKNNIGTLNISSISYTGDKSILPYAFIYYQDTNCDGDVFSSFPLIASFNASFNATTTFTYPSTGNFCRYDYFEIDYLPHPQETINYAGVAANFFETYGLFWHDKYGAIAMPGSSSLYNGIETDFERINCIGYAQGQDISTSFNDKCMKYQSRTSFKDNEIIVVTYTYNDTGGDYGFGAVKIDTTVRKSVKALALHLSGVEFLLNDVGPGNYSNIVPLSSSNFVNLERLIVTIVDEQTELGIEGFLLMNPIITIENLSYIDETTLFTYDNNCITSYAYNSEAQNVNVLYNEFCCTYWKSGDFSSVCPLNWIHSSTTKTDCYMAINTTLDWTSAKEACGNLAEGATLISIENAFENHEAQALMKPCDLAYIGLHETNSKWSWINGDNSTYTNWEQGYPTNDANSTCAAIKSNTKWINQNCAIPSCFVCHLSLKI